ncbi:LysR family transcriptional regulator [Hydrogenophaga sp.]|uniref:LysR family transcriptional regulator n=1 Tax=Hydrogenophaga sp. TaxID=1904254 RepID=UPI0027291235|nr:LysR family transcriptional regulator [Hydrogenophaga sp.]MDO9434961.1 LysR family transcriptional regulator [Hydrogenophaga sp.]
MKTTLDELLAFKTVVDTGSISAAAERLEQTSSGISRALSRLEQKLNTTLMRRTTRRLELSEEGQLFLVRAREILQSVEAAEDELACRHLKPAGKLRVNASSPFMLHLLVPLVNDFLAEYPDIELELHSSENIVDLIEHRADVAVRIGKLRDSTLHAKPLTSFRLRLLASPAYLKQAGRPTKVSDLNRHRLLGFTQPESLNTWPLRHAEGDGLGITPEIAASSGETVRQLALAGAGIACLSDFMTEADRARGDLVQVLMRDTLEVRQPVNAVYYRNTELASRIRCFVDFLALRLAPT